MALYSSSMLVFVVVASLFLATSGQRPVFTTCFQDDPNINACIRDAAQRAVVDLSNGVAEIDLPRLDPLSIPSLAAEGRSSAVNMGVVFRNAILKGLSNAIVDSVEADPQNYRMVFKTRVNGPLELMGNYELEGRAMRIPFSGEGPTKIVLSNVGAVIAIQGHPVERNGAVYMSIDDIDVKLSIGDMNLQLDNLFGGYSRIGNVVNYYANENWPVIMKEMLPSTERNLGLFAKQIAAKVFDNIPYDKIFPRSNYFYNFPARNVRFY